MKIRRAILSATITWLLGVSAYTLSYFMDWMDDKAFQSNLVLVLALIPSTILGAYFYYRKHYDTNGFNLGVIMLITIMTLDALITVPLFIIPEGGNHVTFFVDPWFWLLAIELIMVAWLYSRYRVVYLAPNKTLKTSANKK